MRQTTTFHSDEKSPFSFKTVIANIMPFD